MSFAGAAVAAAIDAAKMINAINVFIFEKSVGGMFLRIFCDMGIAKDGRGQLDVLAGEKFKHRIIDGD